MIELEDVTGELVCSSGRETKRNVHLFGVDHVDDPFFGGFKDGVALRVSGQTNQDKGRIN
jgi:hypothetical protein